MSEPSKNLLIRLWREHVVGFWRLLIVAFILMVIEGSTLGAISYLIQPLFDLVFIDGNSSAVTWVALAISGIFVLRAISGFGQRVLIVTIGLRVTTALQTRLLGLSLIHI